MLDPVVNETLEPIGKVKQMHDLLAGEVLTAKEIASLEMLGRHRVTVTG